MRRPASSPRPAPLRRDQDDTGIGRRVLRAISRTGVALCVPSAVAGAVLLYIGDRMAEVPIETVPGEIGLVLLFIALLGPFGFWCTHLSVGVWVDEGNEAYGFSRPVKVAASVAYGLLGFGIFTFAFMPLLVFTPDEGAGVWDALPVVIVGPILLSVLVAAIAGGVALFGWRGAVVGTFTGVGFIALVAGLTFFPSPLVALLGVMLLVLGTAGFWGLRIVGWRAGRDI